MRKAARQTGAGCARHEFASFVGMTVIRPPEPSGGYLLRIEGNVGCIKPAFPLPLEPDHATAGGDPRTGRFPWAGPGVGAEPGNIPDFTLAITTFRIRCGKRSRPGRFFRLRREACTGNVLFRKRGGRSE